jgi:hypothetical protein
MFCHLGLEFPDIPLSQDAVEGSMKTGITLFYFSFVHGTAPFYSSAAHDTVVPQNITHSSPSYVNRKMTLYPKGKSLKRCRPKATRPFGVAQGRELVERRMMPPW